MNRRLLPILFVCLIAISCSNRIIYTDKYEYRTIKKERPTLKCWFENTFLKKRFYDSDVVVVRMKKYLNNKRAITLRYRAFRFRLAGNAEKIYQLKATIHNDTDNIQIRSCKKNNENSVAYYARYKDSVLYFSTIQALDNEFGLFAREIK